MPHEPGHLAIGGLALREVACGPWLDSPPARGYPGDGALGKTSSEVDVGTPTAEHTLLRTEWALRGRRTSYQFRSIEPQDE